jgi:ectoine hydroxylase-related dioxygenase (phytanoyl-CoA dioxygenase family)
MNRDPIRPITDEDVATYAADGVVCLRQLVDLEWLAYLRDAVEADLAAPGALHNDITRDGSGSFRSDTFVWANIPSFRKFMTDSPAPQATAAIMGSDKVNLLFDQILSKEPATSTETMWHHDATYWPVLGDQICTMWLALDPVTAANGAVEYVKGSHRWGQRFKAKAFVGDGRYKEDLPEVPDIGAERDKHNIVHFELEPGDCVIHHGLLVHGALGNGTPDRRRRGYVSRWCGDDVTYYPRPDIQRMLYDPDIAPGGPIDCRLFPVLWPRPGNLGDPLPPV